MSTNDKNDGMICGNCGEEASVRIVKPVPSCPACSPSAMLTVFTIYVQTEQGIIVTKHNRLGWRWEALENDTIEQWHQEQQESRAPTPRRPWWRRLFGVR